MDVLEYSSRDMELVNKIRGISEEAKPEDCYTCLKCTNGCPANKVFEEFAPHKIQVAARLGFTEELIDSGILWYCFTCFTCQTRCPQQTSPIQTIMSLTNIAVKRGVAPPKVYPEMIKTISEEGAILKPREVSTIDFDFLSREDLDLPKRELRNQEKFKEALNVVGLKDILKFRKKKEAKEQ